MNFLRFLNDFTVVLVDTGLGHDHLQLGDGLFVAFVLAQSGEFLIVTADDLFLGCVLADLVIGDTEADHVDAHVSRGLVDRLAGDLAQ